MFTCVWMSCVWYVYMHTEMVRKSILLAMVFNKYIFFSGNIILLLFPDGQYNGILGKRWFFLPHFIYSCLRTVIITQEADTSGSLRI